MSIATEVERLQTAKADIKAAIENKGVTVGDGTIDTYAEKIGEISGGDNWYDTFWDSVQDSGNRTNYARVFGGPAWNDITFNPKYPISTTTASEMFRYCMITQKEKFSYVDFSNCSNFSSAFASTIAVEFPTIDASNSTTGYYMFSACYYLETIEKLIVSEKIKNYSGTFGGCSALKNITFEGIIAVNISFAQSPLLTNASVQSVIDCLKDLTGATTQTLTLHSDVGANLTDEQKATITAKNWTLVY